MNQQISEKIFTQPPTVSGRPKTASCGRRSRIARAAGLMTLFISFLLTLACQPNQSILNSGPANTETAAGNSDEPRKDTFESALGGVQRSGFDFIFVFRRKDGAPFEKGDKIFVRENSPAQTNQFILTDEERVVIAGSNYPFPEESLEILRKVFDVEDLSPKKANDVNSNANGSANANSNGNANGGANDGVNRENDPDVN